MTEEGKFSGHDGPCYSKPYVEVCSGCVDASIKERDALAQKLETANTENTNLRFTLTVLEERLIVAEFERRDARGKLEEIAKIAKEEMQGDQDLWGIVFGLATGCSEKQVEDKPS